MKKIGNENEIEGNLSVMGDCNAKVEIGGGLEANGFKAHSQKVFKFFLEITGNIHKII